MTSTEVAKAKFYTFGMDKQVFVHYLTGQITAH